MSETSEVLMSFKDVTPLNAQQYRDICELFFGGFFPMALLMLTWFE